MRALLGFEAKGLRVDLINRSPIASFHQYGTQHLPARPIIEVTKIDIQRLQRDVTAAMRRTMRAT